MVESETIGLICSHDYTRDFVTKYRDDEACLFNGLSLEYKNNLLSNCNVRVKELLFPLVKLILICKNRQILHMCQLK